MDKFNGVNGIICTASFFWTRLAICSSLLVFHLQLVWLKSFDDFQFNQFKFYTFSLQAERVPNPNEIVFTLFMIFYSFIAILGFCSLGEVVTNRFDTFNEELCNKNWYLFPSELQRMLVIFMSIVQKSVIIHGSGKAACRLEAFKKVKSFAIQFYWCIQYFFINITNSSPPIRLVMKDSSILW